MLLALRRLFGWQTSAASEQAEEARDWRQYKWVILPTRQGFFSRVEEVWRYRRILWFFAVQRIRDRYEGTTLGPFWLFARPLMPIAISTVVFGRLLNVPSDGVPYFLFFLAGSSCWRIFERSMLWTTQSLEAAKGLIKKVYFPRIIAPIASVAPALTEFAILFTLLVLACLVYWIKDGTLYLRLGLGMLAGVIAVALTCFFAVAIGLWTSVLQVRHKDIRYSVRYANQFWSYATPVIYPMSQVPPKYHFIMYLNPMAPLVEMYKWGMLGTGQFPAKELACAMVIIGIVFGAGLVFFNRSEAASIDRL
jgi:lipopolysaccharide transport system permease protein